MSDTITNWANRIVEISQRCDVPDDVKVAMGELAVFLRERDVAELDAAKDLQRESGCDLILASVERADGTT